MHYQTESSQVEGALGLFPGPGPGTHDGGVGEADLRLKLVLSVLDLVSPGISLGHGLILFELQQERGALLGY